MLLTFGFTCSSSSSAPATAALSVPLRCFHFGVVVSRRETRPRRLPLLHLNPVRVYISHPALHCPMHGSSIATTSGASPSVTRKLSIRPKSETTSSATNSFHSLFRMISLSLPLPCPPTDRPTYLTLEHHHHRWTKTTTTLRVEKRVDENDMEKRCSCRMRSNRKSVVLFISDAVYR